MKEAVPATEERRRVDRDPSPDDAEPWVGAVAVFLGVTVAVVTAAVVAARAAGVELHHPEALPYLLAAAWGPSCGRLAARATVDRGRPAPFGLFGPGWSPLTVVLPVAAVTLVYGAAYGAGGLLGDVRWAGVPAPGALSDLARGLPLVVLAALGHELGWRGWLQPRLDRAGIRGSLPMVVVFETLSYLPLLVGWGWAGDAGVLVGLMMLVLLKVGAVPVWTWAQYRRRTVWAAVWFHAAHVAVGRELGPALFVEVGPSWMVGEVGVLPIIAYLGASLGVLGLLWFRGGSFSAFARWSLGAS